MGKISIEDYRTLLREIKEDPNKWRDTSMFSDWNQVVKMFQFSKS